jgi:hypothetical protein
LAKKKHNKINPFILTLICAVLLFVAYNSLSTVALELWGQTVMGTVDSYDSRLDDTNAGENRSRTVSKGYSFSVDGKEYRGYVIYSSDEAWPRLEEGEVRSERIRYFSFFPYINKPSMLTDFDQMGAAGLLYHLFAPTGCIFLFLLVTGNLKKKKKAAKKDAAVQKSNTRRDLDMFCQNCGSKLPTGAAFCANCGAKAKQDNSNICDTCGATIPKDAVFCINCGAAVNSGETGSAKYVAPTPQESHAVQRAGLVGFSDRYNSPEILEAAKKNRKSSIGCMWILVFVPLIGFPITGLLMDDFPFGESVVIGVGIALVMLIVNLFGLRRAKQPMWEGVVTNKFSKERHHHNRTNDESDTYSTYTEYTTVIRTDTGKKKKLIERDSQRDMYDYLAVGDRVRYHPAFDTYEKYDKSKDRIIYCNVCRMMNPIQNDHCKRCNNLLFK